MKIFISGILGGAIGGLVTYIFGLTATGMGITFIPGLLLYTSSVGALVQYLIVIAAAFASAFFFVRLQAKKISEEINA
jgi:PTS system sucrose-specific IIC component